MARFITRAGCTKILVITILGIAVLPFTPGFKQQRNMRLAEAHAEKLRPVLRNDPRFKNVKLEEYTGMGGALWVRAEVENEQDKEALEKFIAASKPPVRVRFLILTKDGSSKGHVVDIPAAK